MMPNIPGLGVILALLFAPQAEIRRNSQLTRLSNVLSGLGFDPMTKSSHFPEHDAVFNIDVNLDSNDFMLINLMRHSMSQMFFLKPSETKPSITEVYKAKLKMRIKNTMIK